MTSSYICSCCGKSHDGMPTDHGWQLPDDVWAIPASERQDKAKFDSDLCQFGNRFFIRCVLKLPFIEQPDFYAWGIWVEVSKSDFYRYVELYDEDGSAEPQINGVIANAISGYPSTIGIPVLVQFQSSTSRPRVTVSNKDHPLADEQLNGINNFRYHEILTSTGSLSGL